MARDIAPTTVEALEEAVRTCLEQAIPDLTVEAYPDDSDNYVFSAPVGAALVRYHGSKYGPSLDTAAVIQERHMAVEITVICRSLNGQYGVTAYLEQVRRALTGHQPPGFDKLRPIKDEFLQEGGGQWRYAIDFATSTLSVEDCEPESGPPAGTINFHAPD
jgi:hypothetical protein